MKYSRFFNLWSVFKLLDPDPDPYIIYGSGFGSRRANNIRIRLDPDPDPQHCLYQQNSYNIGWFVLKNSLMARLSRTAQAVKEFI